MDGDTAKPMSKYSSTKVAPFPGAVKLEVAPSVDAPDAVLLKPLRLVPTGKEQEIIFSATDLMAIRASLSPEARKVLAAAPVVKRGWIACEDCPHAHHYFVRWSATAQICDCMLKSPLCWLSAYWCVVAGCHLCSSCCCPQAFSPTIYYICETTGRTIEPHSYECRECKQRHPLYVTLNHDTNDCCAGGGWLCAYSCESCSSKGVPYYVHNMDRVTCHDLCGLGCGNLPASTLV